MNLVERSPIFLGSHWRKIHGWLIISGRGAETTGNRPVLFSDDRIFEMHLLRRNRPQGFLEVVFNFLLRFTFFIFGQLWKLVYKYFDIYPLLFEHFRVSQFDSFPKRVFCHIWNKFTNNLQTVNFFSKIGEKLVFHEKLSNNWVFVFRRQIFTGFRGSDSHQVLPFKDVAFFLLFGHFITEAGACLDTI